MTRLRSSRALPIVALLACLCLGGAGNRSGAAAARPDTAAIPLAAYRQLLLDREPRYLSVPATLRTADVAPESLAAGVATVTFAAGVDAAEAAARVGALGMAAVYTILEQNVYEVSLPKGWSVDEGITALSELPGALRAEPVVRSRLDFHPNDPLYDSYQPYLPVIHADAAWDIQQGDPKIVVAVLDAGLEITHPDLVGRVWTNPRAGATGCGNDLHGCNFVDPKLVNQSCLAANTNAVPNPDISPAHWHGTFVAGVIGAATNNGTGIAGIVPHATIMPVRVADCEGELWSPGVASAVNYAVNNGAAVINLSSGSTRCAPVPSYQLEAIDQAVRRGVVVVAAGGNDGLGCVSAPANTPGVIAVGAISSFYDQRAFFSNWGPQIAVAAPGWQIMSTTVPRGGQAPFDLYRISSGTSFSAPIVSGLADLLLSQNPLLTPAQVLSIIQRGATPLSGGEPNWAGAGRVDLAASLRLVPAAFYGKVLVDGAPAPDGTVIEARVGRQVCGQAFSSAKDGQAIYALVVASDADQPGCGKAGVQVALTVNGVPSATVDWKNAGVQLDLGGGAVGPQAGPTASKLYSAGWNLVAGPAGTIFAGVDGPLFTLQPDSAGYTSVPNGGPTRTGFGYWAFFPRDTTVTLAADGPSDYTIALPAGRYVMVGNPSGTRPASVSGGDSVLTFDPAMNAYAESRTLQPGQGALVVSFDGGRVTVSAGGR